MLSTLYDLKYARILEHGKFLGKEDVRTWSGKFLRFIPISVTAIV